MEKVKSKAMIMQSFRDMDGVDQIDTFAGRLRLDEFLMEILKSGGDFRSLGATRLTYNGYDTIMIILFVMIPELSNAIKYIEMHQHVTIDEGGEK